MEIKENYCDALNAKIICYLHMTTHIATRIRSAIVEHDVLNQELVYSLARRAANHVARMAIAQGALSV